MNEEWHSECYDESGILVEPDNKKICAKHLINNRTGISTFYIKQSSSGLYKPTRRYAQYVTWKFIKVPQLKFVNYIHFLQTKHEKFFTQAERIM